MNFVEHLDLNSVSSSDFSSMEVSLVFKESEGIRGIKIWLAQG